MIDGDILTDGIETISNEFKVVGSGDGGRIYKNTSKYHTKDDAQVNEEHVKGGKEEGLVLFKAIEA